MAGIGEPEEYEVSLESTESLRSPFGVDFRSASPYRTLAWSSIDWQRVENGVSVAKVVVGNDAWGRTLCPFPLRAWDLALGIRRNGLLVWWGPIMGWRYNQRVHSWEIAAKDILQLAARAYIPTDATYTNQYPGVLISGVVNSLMSCASAVFVNMDPALVDPDNYDTVLPLVSRTYAATQLVPGLEAILDVVAEIDGVATAVAGWTHLGYRYVDPLTVVAGGTLSESTTVDRPSIVVDAENCATTVWAINGSFGGTGVAYTVDVLAYMTNYDDATPAYLSAYSGICLQSRVSGDGRDLDATALAKGFAEAIEVMNPHVTIEQIQLAPNFGHPATPGMVDGDGGWVKNINDLVCGRFVADWKFEDDCLVDIPVCTPYSDWVTHIGKFFRSPTVKHVRLGQLDVHVEKGEDGALAETILSSWRPVALAGDS